MKRSSKDLCVEELICERMPIAIDILRLHLVEYLTVSRTTGFLIEESGSQHVTVDRVIMDFRTRNTSYTTNSTYLLRLEFLNKLFSLILYLTCFFHSVGSLNGLTLCENEVKRK